MNVFFFSQCDIYMYLISKLKKAFYINVEISGGEFLEKLHGANQINSSFDLISLLLSARNNVGLF